MAEVKHTQHPHHETTSEAKLPQAGAGDPGYGLGIAAFVVSFFVGIAGLVMGIIAVKQSKQAGLRNTFGFAGFVIGIVKTALDVLAILGMIIGAVWLISYCSSHQTECSDHNSPQYQYNQDYYKGSLPDTGQTY